MDYDFGYDFSDVNTLTEFSEMDDNNWNYLDNDDVDEYYEICERHYRDGYEY